MSETVEPFEILEQDGIVHTNWAPGVAIDLALARRTMEATAAAAGGQPALVLVDLSPVRGIDRAARQYYQENTGGKVKALAFVTRNAVSRVIANFFIGLNRPVMPTRMFETEDDAVRWLREQA